MENTGGAPSAPPCVVYREGMAWETADVLSADTADVLPADTTDVLPAGTTHVSPADKFAVGTSKFERGFREGFCFGCQGVDF